MGTTADKLAYLKETKNAIKSKLIEKGVAVSDTDTFRNYADKIDEVGGDYEIIESVNVNLDLADGNQTISAGEGYAVKNATIIKPSALIPENIVEGINIAGVVGTVKPVADMIEQKTVELDFSGGDIEVTPTEGKVISLVNIPQPETLIPENIAEGITIAGITGTHSGGTGGSGEAVVWFVTFIGADGTELYNMPVLDGDNCKDPYTTGKITKPTKESTAQYDFEHSGWSLTNGGDADSTALQAVTEDRTVYAAFTATVRTYTITYYDTDGTTVLNSEVLAYGSMPSYVPEKSGASFIEWQPALATVTSDTSYTAVWQEKVTFAGGTWEDIIAIAEAGQAEEYFAVGDTREIPWGSTGYNVTVQIAGFNHDDLYDGSGKAAMSITCVNIPPDTLTFRTYTSNSNPHAYVNPSTFANSLPSVLRNALKYVSKEVESGYSSHTSITTGKYRVFPLSLTELNWTKYTTDANKMAVLGEPYAVYAENDFKAFTLCSTGEKVEAWLRARTSNGLANQYYVRTAASGNGWWIGGATTETAKPVLFGFCI